MNESPLTLLLCSPIYSSDRWTCSQIPQVQDESPQSYAVSCLSSNGTPPPGPPVWGSFPPEHVVGIFDTLRRNQPTKPTPRLELQMQVHSPLPSACSHTNTNFSIYQRGCSPDTVLLASVIKWWSIPVSPLNYPSKQTVTRGIFLQASLVRRLLLFKTTGIAPILPFDKCFQSPASSKKNPSCPRSKASVVCRHTLRPSIIRLPPTLLRPLLHPLHQSWLDPTNAQSLP